MFVRFNLSTFIKARLGRFFRNIAWIPVYINKYIWAGIKRLRKPKIVEKEVVVEKEVEKIVEKNIGEKIVYEKVEVPKEVVSIARTMSPPM